MIPYLILIKSYMKESSYNNPITIAFSQPKGKKKKKEKKTDSKF